MFEEQMRDKIREFMINTGYEVYEIIPMLYGKADFVGINDYGECIVIESKISKWKDALNQIINYGYGADYQYIAMPKKKSKYVFNNYAEILSKYKVGLLSVNAEKVDVLLSFKKSDCSHIYKNILINKINQRKNNSNERIKLFIERCNL